MSVEAVSGRLRRWRHWWRTGARRVHALACLAAVALVLIATTVYEASLREDALQRTHEERIVAARMTGAARGAARNATDYAWWDDAVRHLALALDPAWAAQNIGPTPSATLGYDLSLAVDGR